MDSNNVWKANKDTPLLCIQVRDGSTIGVQSVYPMELLAIVGAPQLAARIKISVDEIVTEGLGCCQITIMKRRHPQLTNKYIAHMGLLQHYLKAFEGTLKWTPADSEKMNSMSVN